MFGIPIGSTDLLVKRVVLSTAQAQCGSATNTKILRMRLDLLPVMSREAAGHTRLKRLVALSAAAASMDINLFRDPVERRWEAFGHGVAPV